MDSVVRGGARREGPRIISRVSRQKSRGGIGGANATANRKTDVDVRVRARGCTADGEARENEEGEVGNTEGASRAKWSSREGRREGKGGAVAERPPLFMPISYMTVLKQPRAETWTVDGKIIV